MAADFVVIDRSGALVSQSFPYSRFFVTSITPFFPPPSALAYLILTVKTGYTDNLLNAAVSINGATIGTIDPRPWVNHFSLDLETMIFVFNNTLLGRPGFLQTLRIVRQGNLADPTNFLLVGNAICHYRA